MNDERTLTDPTWAAVVELTEQVDRLERAVHRHLENTNTANRMIGAIMQSAGELNDIIIMGPVDDPT